MVVPLALELIAFRVFDDGFPHLLEVFRLHSEEQHLCSLLHGLRPFVVIRGLGDNVMPVNARQFARVAWNVRVRKL